MDKGKFIVIEGIDGSGKSSQVKKIAELLKEKVEKLHVTKECSDGPIGQLLRKEYLSGNQKCDERVINHLMAADRLDHITNKETGMLKYINEGYTVLCDRYALSSFAYDTYMLFGTNEYEDALYEIITRNRVNLELLTPDITIVIDIPVETALERMNSNRENLTVYESKEKLEKIRDSYLYSIELLKEEFDNHIVLVSGIGTEEEVCERIMKEIYKII